MENEKNNELTAAKVELRERIITVAFKAFRENGIKSVTMDEVANRLGISKRTLYEVFNDKEELLIAGLKKQRDEMIAYMTVVMERASNVLEVILKFYERSIEAYHKTNRRFFEDMHKYPKVREFHEQHHKENSENSTLFFMKGVEQGIFRDDVNFDVIQTLSREQIKILNNTNIFDRYSFIEVYESIMFVYVRGIATEKGQKILEDFVQKYRLKNKKG